MDEDISLLLAFYNRCGPEAIGHGPDELDADKAALIERFIAGHCDASERRELSAFLLQNPERIRWIAEQIESKREPARQSI